MAKQMQTKKAKEEFYSPLTDYLRVTRTKEEASSYLMVSERKVRDEVNSIRKHHAVISGSFIKGYRLARRIDLMNQDEKQEEHHLVERTIAEFNSRINDMRKSLKPLIAYRKVLEKQMQKK